MRSASVLVVNLRGIATEVCKNVVLAGIGKLTVLDDKDIMEEDLGSGFFFREEELGQKVSRQTFLARALPCDTALLMSLAVLLKPISVFMLPRTVSTPSTRESRSSRLPTFRICRTRRSSSSTTSSFSRIQTRIP